MSAETGVEILGLSTYLLVDKLGPYRISKLVKASSLKEERTVVMLGTDMKVAETPKEGLKDYAKADPYAEWLKKEGVKVYQDFYFPSLAKVELGPWERKGGSGAVIHIDNRHMPNDCHVVEIKPGGKSEPEHHLYELTIYVVSGRGARERSA